LNKIVFMLLDVEEKNYMEKRLAHYIDINSQDLPIITSILFIKF
jgi:hypothetical protein